MICVDDTELDEDLDLYFNIVIQLNSYVDALQIIGEVGLNIVV
jgi:hypothetical protein